MAPPLQQPRAEGAGSRGRDEDHAALVSSRKRPRVVAETHDDSVAFARAASLRASDYGAWLSESKTKWRSLRKKLAVVRNFVELEANGDSLELGGILDPTGARLLAREKNKKKRGFSRWKTTRAEEVRVGDIPQLTGDFKRLLAMLEANPATGGRAPTGDDGKETNARAAGAGADADARDDANDDAGASRFAFEGERLEDSDDDLFSESSESDDSGDDDAEDADVREERPEEEGDDESEDRVEDDAEAEVGVGVEKEKEKGVPERSAADALAAYGDIDPPPPPQPPVFAPPPGGFVNPHPAVARESNATLATLMPPPPPQPRSPRAATASGAASGAAGALAAYGFDETQIVFPTTAPFVSQAPVPPHAHAALTHATVTHGSDARAGAFEDPWVIPSAAGLDSTEIRRAARDDASVRLREGAPRAARVSGSLQVDSLTVPARPVLMDDELRAAAALCAKPWLDLSVGDVETVLAQVKYLISRRRRAHKQGRAERRKRRLVSRAAETARAAAAAAGPRTVNADASTDPERVDGPGPGSGSGSGSRPAGTSGPFRLPNDFPPSADLASAARHTCVACDRVFDMPHKLRDHMHEHAGTAPHRCPFPGCARAFANRASLARHRLLHEKRHSCSHPACGRHFPTAWALRSHERSHSENRPFACEVPGCGKRFKDEYTLVAHARVHTGEKRFACGDDGEPGCGKRFGYKVDLKRHRERCAAARGDE